VWSCPTSCTITGSTAVIDASAFCVGSCAVSTANDFCVVLSNALSALPKPDGTHLQGVVDARGVVPDTNTFMECASNPFQNLNSGNVGNISVLLPALTIRMQFPWILPSSIL
jgi:hypothetical protein